MSRKRSCPGGTVWDKLVNACIHDGAEPEPSREPLLPSDPALAAAAPAGPSQSTSPVNPTLWTLVVLTTAGSVLALVLWLLIFIRRRRRTAGSGGPDRLTKTEVLDKPAAPPMGESRGSAHSCHRDPAHPPALSGPSRGPLWGHRVPLPATELGGTALVTTKTVAAGVGS